MSFKPISRKTLPDAVFEQISTAIVHGEMRPGAQLPSERELCQALQVNRGAVREALKRLAQAGLIATHQGGGTRVLNFRQTASLDLISRLLFLPDGTVDLKVARSVIEMRAAMAPDIARLCARRHTPAIATKLRGCIASMHEAAVDLLQLQQLALDFWDILVSGSDNIAYQLVFNNLRETYDHLREPLLHVLADELQDIEAYETIAAAVARGDELSATHVARALMEKGTRGIFELLAAIEDPPNAEETPS